MARKGRRPKFNKELCAKVVLSIRNGNFYETACQSNGITSRTFYYWLELGRENPDTEWGKFLREVEAARAQAEEAAVSRIKDHGQKNWMAEAWWLERINYEKWGRREPFKGASDETKVEIVIKDAAGERNVKSAAEVKEEQQNA